MASFLTLHPRLYSLFQAHPRLICPRTLPLFLIPAKILPQSSTPELRPPLCLPVLALHSLAAKFRTPLRLVNGSQSLLQHLIRHVASAEWYRKVQSPPHVDSGYRTLVLVWAMDIGADPTVEEIRGQPLVGFASKRLFGTAEMCELGGVDSG